MTPNNNINSSNNMPLNDDSVIAQKCENCGAPLVFNPKIGMMECEWCRHTYTVEDIKSQKIHINRQERDHVLSTMQPLPIYHCNSCGANVIAPPENGAMTCPYCQNHIVLTKQFSGTIKPDGIIPFKFKSDKLVPMVKKYFKDNKQMLPRGFFTKSRIGKVTGIYVPFWVFDCDVAGDVEYDGYSRGTSSVSGGYRYTNINHYDLQRTVSMSFKDLAVDASHKMADELMDSIQPFDFSEIKSFDVEYLAGYVADRFEQTSQESRKRSDLRVLNTAANMARKKTTGSYSGVSVTRNSLGVTLKNDRYYLLPVYCFTVDFKDQKYSFAVNGQTGRVAGKLPEIEDEGWGRFRIFFAVGFIITAIILFLFFVL